MITERETATHCEPCRFKTDDYFVESAPEPFAMDPPVIQEKMAGLFYQAHLSAFGMQTERERMGTAGLQESKSFLRLTRMANLVEMHSHAEDINELWLEHRAKGLPSVPSDCNITRAGA